MRLSPLMGLPLLMLAGCSPVPPPVSKPIPFFGEGYRTAGDPCRRVGESPLTVDLLDDAADLVGCPADMENLGVFVTDTGAVDVARIDDTGLYSVPIR